MAIFVGYSESSEMSFDSGVVRGPARTVTPAPMVRHDALLVRQLVSASSSGARRRAVSASGADILGARTVVTFCEVVTVRGRDFRTAHGRTRIRGNLSARPSLASSRRHHTTLRAVGPAVMASRSALIEEGAVESVHAKLIADRAPPQIGLIVGKREAGARDIILALVPFPDWNAEGGDDDGDGAGSGTTGRPQRPASGGAPLDIDADAILEHTTQVTRMLPGGLDVVGAYAFASEGAWRSASGALARAAVAAAAAAAPAPDASAASSVSDPELFLLHLSAEDMRKKSLRRVRRSTMAQPFALLPPAESREGKALASLVSLEAEVAVGLSAVVPRAFATRSGTAKQHTLRSALEAALRLETARVMGADALVENALWDDDVAVSAVPRRSAANDFLDENPPDGAESNAPTGDVGDVFALRAELLVAPTSVLTRLHPNDNDNTLAQTSSEDGLQKTNVVRLTFEGVVSARSYAFARANVGDAVSDLRRDVARSLRSRLDTFLDEADDALEEEESHNGVTSHNALASIERALSSVVDASSGKERETSGALLADAMRLETNDDASRETVLTFAMPRRAWARWLGGLSVCDYLAQGETEADVVARCAEVMRFEVPGGVKGVALAEREAVSRRSGGGGGGAKRETRNAKPTPETSPASSGTKSKSSSSYAAYALGAGVALVSAGLANLAMSSPDIAACVGELCERAAETAQGAL